MCGRYALRLPGPEVRARVEEQLDRHVGAWEDEDDYNGPERGYNIPPRTYNPVVLRGGGGVSDNYDSSNNAATTPSPSKLSPLRIQNMQWGLVPHWMKRLPDHSSMLKTINARDDTIQEGGSMWKSVRGRKRCIVVAEGFYEWLKKGNDRIPHHVKRKDGKLMCFAGMWDDVIFEGEKDPLYTYTIITTNSNKQLAFLHDRMPVILDSVSDIETWLDTTSGNWTQDLSKLLKPYEGELECYIVPKEVGKVGQQSSDFLKPVAERKGNISSMFAKQAEKNAHKAEHGDEDKPSRHEAVESTLDSKYSPSKPASSGKTKIKTGVPATKVDGEETGEELPLNPDEGDKVESLDASFPKSDTEGKVVQPVTSSAKAKGKGKRKEPIVLDDSEDDPKEGDSPAHETRSRPSMRKVAGENKTKVQPRKKRKGSSSPVKPDKAEVDGQGNEKLTNFFEIQDD